MSVAKVSAVRTGSSERSRLWTQQALDEQAELEARAAKPMNDKIAAATREAALSAGKLAAAELTSELQNERYRLTHESSPDFVAPQYDGRFKSAKEITDAITASWEHFKSRTDDTDCSLVYAFLQQNFNTADTTRPETFELAYQFCLSKLRAVEARYAAPEPEVIASEPPIAPEDRITLDIQHQIDALPVGNSREKERLERLLHKHQVSVELILKDSIRDILEEIVEQSGKVLSASHNLQYRQWLASPLQKNRYTSSREDSRLSFSEYFGCPEILTQVELDEVSRRKRVGALTSSQVKEITGATNTYGFDIGRRV